MRVGTDIIAHLSKLSSLGRTGCRNRILDLKDFFRADEPQCVPADVRGFLLKEQLQGLDLSPVHGIFKGCFKINEQFGRVLYMRDYASYVRMT